MGRLERYFRPDQHVPHVYDIDLDALWAKGVRGLILDLDNTLVPWRSTDVPPEVAEWSRRAREMGFRLVIASNTRRYRRLGIVAESLGAQFVRGVAKPRRGGFRAAAALLRLPLTAVAVIGDQLLTDVLAARRLGIRSILVDRLSDREFIITRANRRLESAILRTLLRRNTMPPDAGGGAA